MKVEFLKDPVVYYHPMGKSKAFQANRVQKSMRSLCACVCAHSFDLCTVSELLDGVTVLSVVLQQDGHLEGGGLQRVPETSTAVNCSDAP